MHITVVVFGTWGDLRPNVVLAQALKQAGHHVQVLTTRDFEDWVRTHTLDYAPIQVNIQAMLDDMTSSSNPIKFLRMMREKIAPAMLQFAADTAEATRESDVMLVHEMGTPALSGVVEANNLTQININLQPLTRTRTIQIAGFPPLPDWMPLQAVYNNTTYTFWQRLIWTLLGSRGNEFRTEHLNLPKMTWGQYQHMLKNTPTLTLVSEHLLPRPADWRANQHLTGFLFDHDEAWEAPQSLVDFLAAGEKPIYVGFGSMADKKPEETTRIVLAAMRQTGKRAVILSGWAGIGQTDVPDNVHILKYAPHSWLFPRMAALIHHGGAGTTAAGIRAGVPAIVVPHLSDQPYWGNLLHQNGVATRNIPRGKLSVDRLVAAIHEVTSSQQMHERAAQLGEKIRAEDSVGKTMQVIDHALSNRP